MLGGGEYSFLDLIFHLPQSWKCVTVVPRNGEMADRLRGKGIVTHTIALPPIRPLKIFLILDTFKLFIRLYRRCRPSLIYTNGSRAAFYGGVIGRILRIPVIWHCRITEPDPLLDYILTKLCTRIIANSKSTAARFGKKVRPKVIVIYNGIDLKWYQNSSIQKPVEIKKEWNVILSVARISKSKRHDLAITAFEQGAHLIPDVHLICIGDVDHSESEWWRHLQRRTANSSFSERIHWMGHADDVRPWYHAAQMLIFPSENESFGRVLVEAMACGLPVISTRSGGVSEIVRHGKDGFLVTPGEKKELAAAVYRILSDDTLKKRLGHSAQRRAEKFDLHTHLKHMLAVFDELSLR
jgi:glycosyltransferase involved in cell wall biosynthesis